MNGRFGGLDGDDGFMWELDMFSVCKCFLVSRRIYIIIYIYHVGYTYNYKRWMVSRICCLPRNLGKMFTRFD